MQEPSTSSEPDTSIDIENVVRHYSKHMALFCFEKAIEYIEDLKKTPLNNTWPMLLNIMSQVRRGNVYKT